MKVSVEKDISGFYIVKLDNHIVHRGQSISVLYTYNPEQKEGGMHKYGSQEFCEERGKKIQELYASDPVFQGDEIHVITSNKIDPYHIQRMIDTSGWVGIWHRAYVLGEKESLKRIESLQQRELQ